MVLCHYLLFHPIVALLLVPASVISMGHFNSASFWKFHKGVALGNENPIGSIGRAMSYVKILFKSC